MAEGSSQPASTSKSGPVIHVIGSLHLDFVTTTPRCPGPGETIQATRFDVNAGGKGANQAAACGRAAATSPGQSSISVQMIGAVGANDPYFEKIWRTLQDSLVSTTSIREIAGTTTGTATIIVDEGAGGENRILFVPGAGFIGMDDANEVIARTDSVPDVVVLQAEIPRATVLAILEYYNGSETTQVVFNPAPVWPQGIPSTALNNLAVLIVNETECLLLIKSMVTEGHDMTLVEREADLDQAVLKKTGTEFHKLLKVKTLIVTLGSKGVFYSHLNGQTGIIAGEKVDKVVDTTAAGDTFVGYVTVELVRAGMKGQTDAFDVAAACSKANKAAAKCVTRAGAMQSIPFGYEIS